MKFGLKILTRIFKPRSARDVPHLLATLVETVDLDYGPFLKPSKAYWCLVSSTSISSFNGSSGPGVETRFDSDLGP